jgi:hypothetical protein
MEDSVSRPSRVVNEGVGSAGGGWECVVQEFRAEGAVPGGKFAALDRARINELGSRGMFVWQI